MRRGVITYTDYLDREVELTDAEIRWFHEWVNRAKEATGCEVDIIPFDHELYSGKHKDALGCCITTDPGNTLGDGVDTYITIDCYFIDECWRHEFEGEILIGSETLQEVLAHEIAHLTVWRHGKKHTALTEKLLRQIEAA